jgi:hypothetical protein
MLVGLAQLLLPGRVAKVADHLVQLVLQHRYFAARLHSDLSRQIPFRHRGGYVRDRFHLVCKVGRELIDVVSQVLPHAGDLRGLGLPSELALDPHPRGRLGSPRRRIG